LHDDTAAYRAAAPHVLPLPATGVTSSLARLVLQLPQVSAGLLHAQLAASLHLDPEGESAPWKCASLAAERAVAPPAPLRPPLVRVRAASDWLKEKRAWKS